VLLQANVRRLKVGVSIKELTEDIARRALLQSVSIRPVLNADCSETVCSRCRPALRFPGARASRQAQAHGSFDVGVDFGEVEDQRLGPCVRLAASRANSRCCVDL
jgi:hypothetical protein